MLGNYMAYQYMSFNNSRVIKYYNLPRKLRPLNSPTYYLFINISVYVQT